MVKFHEEMLQDRSKSSKIAPKIELSGQNWHGATLEGTRIIAGMLWSCLEGWELLAWVRSVAEQLELANRPEAT